MKQATILTRIEAMHPAAVHFNNDFDILAKRRDEVVGGLRHEAAKATGRLRREYKYTVLDASSEPFLARDIRDLRPIRIVRDWVNKATFDQAMQLYGVHISNIIPVQTMSPVYYRLHQILLSTGRGVAMLATNIPCDDNSWNEITQGIFGQHISKG